MLFGEDDKGKFPKYYSITPIMSAFFLLESDGNEHVST